MYELGSGCLRKLAVLPTIPLTYQLYLEGQIIELNQYIGKSLYLQYQSLIHCIRCGRKTRVSFQQGYCFACMRQAAECDLCIVKPEHCHYARGTCRDPQWGLTHCMQPHIVYLANSSGLKIGITRHTQIPTRWLDQGAQQALPIIRTATRYQAGVVEVCLKQFVSDRTNWRRLLTADSARLDLLLTREQLLAKAHIPLQAAVLPFAATDIQWLNDEQPVEFIYPISSYPKVLTTLTLQPDSTIGGILLGIKGQYLLFEQGAINIRKFSGYHVQFMTKT